MKSGAEHWCNQQNAALNVLYTAAAIYSWDVPLAEQKQKMGDGSWAQWNERSKRWVAR